MKILKLFSSSNTMLGANNMLIVGLFVALALIFMFSKVLSKNREPVNNTADEEEEEELDTPGEFQEESSEEEDPLVPAYEAGGERTLVTLMTFTYPHEMSIIAAMLNSEGIEVFGKDEMTINANPLMSNMIGGVKMQVWSPDAPRATKLLKQAGYLQ